MPPFNKNKVIDYLDVIEASPVSHCIFILDLTPDFNGVGENNCNTRRKKFKFWNLLRLILEIWQ